MLGHPISGQARSDLDFFKVEQTHIVGAATVAATFEVARPLATAVGGTSALGDTLSRAVALLDGGGFAGTSAMTDTMRRAVALLDGGGFAGTATLGTLTMPVARKLIEAMVAQAALSDTLKVARSLAGSIHGQATTVDTLRRAVALLDGGGFAGAATLANEPLSVKRALGLPTLAGSATMTDAAKVARAMADAVHGVSSTSATINVHRAYVVAHAGSAQLTASEATKRAFTSSMNGRATLADSINIARALSLIVQGDVVVIADLTVSGGGGGSVALAVTFSGAGYPAFAWTRRRPFATSILGSASDTSAIRVLRNLSEHVLGAGGFSDSIQVARVLNAHVYSGGVLSGGFSAVRPLSAGMRAGVLVGASLRDLRALGLSVEGGADALSSLDILRGIGLIVQARALLDEQMSIARAMGLSVAAEVRFKGMFVLNPPIPLGGITFYVSPANYPTPPVPPTPIVIHLPPFKA